MIDSQEKKSDYVSVDFAIKSLDVPAQLFSNGALEQVKDADGLYYIHKSVIGPYLAEREIEWLSSPYSF